MRWYCIAASSTGAKLGISVKLPWWRIGATPVNHGALTNRLVWCVFLYVAVLILDWRTGKRRDFEGRPCEYCYSVLVYTNWFCLCRVAVRGYFLYGSFRHSNVWVCVCGDLSLSTSILWLLILNDKINAIWFYGVWLLDWYLVMMLPCDYYRVGSLGCR